MITGVSGDIPHIGIVNAHVQGRVPRPFQGRHRCGREVENLEVGMKPGKMDGYVRANLSRDPTTQPLNHGVRVVEGRHHEIDDFEMDAAARCCPDGLQDRIEVCPAHIAVKGFAEALQIDLYGIQMPARSTGGGFMMRN